MKFSELQSKSREELNQLLADLKAKLLRLNFDLMENKVKDVSQFKKAKKDIARILTSMKQPKS